MRLQIVGILGIVGILRNGQGIRLAIEWLSVSCPSIPLSCKDYAKLFTHILCYQFGIGKRAVMVCGWE